MSEPQPAFTPLNAYRALTAASPYTVPLSSFTLDPVLPQAASTVIERHPIADGAIVGPNTRVDNMPGCDCFDVGKGHFASADNLFDKGVWIGYFARES
jgi:hypothetical protein